MTDTPKTAAELRAQEYGLQHEIAEDYLDVMYDFLAGRKDFIDNDLKGKIVLSEDELQDLLIKTRDITTGYDNVWGYTHTVEELLYEAKNL